MHKMSDKVESYNKYNHDLVHKVTIQSLALMSQSRQSRALELRWKSQTTVNRILRGMNGWLEKSRTGQAWARNSSSARAQTGCMVTVGWRAEEHKMMCYWGRNAPHNDTNVWSGLSGLPEISSGDWRWRMTASGELAAVREEGSICTHAAKQRKWQTKYGSNKVLEIPPSDGQRSRQNLYELWWQNH